MSTMNSNTRIVATVFRRDMVCLRSISVDTLHKRDTEGDDDDDNDDDNNNNNNIICRNASAKHVFI
jgi:hypothetical protein